MKTEWRRNVYLARSKIQGLGLFAARDMDKNAMIIEYVGELIRNEVANHRERVYDLLVRKQGNACFEVLPASRKSSFPKVLVVFTALS